MWIFKKKWKKLKKRVADLEGQVQSQQQDITNIAKKLLEMRLTKSGGTYHYRYEDQSGVQASICPDAQQK